MQWLHLPQVVAVAAAVIVTAVPMNLRLLLSLVTIQLSSHRFSMS